MEHRDLDLDPFVCAPVTRALLDPSEHRSHLAGAETGGAADTDDGDEGVSQSQSQSAVDIEVDLNVGPDAGEDAEAFQAFDIDSANRQREVLTSDLTSDFFMTLSLSLSLSRD